MGHFNFTTEAGAPDGGHCFGPGYLIVWQRGPLTECRNGAFIIEVIDALLDRMKYPTSAKRIYGTGFALDFEIMQKPDFLRVLQDQIKWYDRVNGGAFDCPENKIAATCLGKASRMEPSVTQIAEVEIAIKALRSRLERRRQNGDAVLLEN